ncbi:hypothetical protein [Agrobacterium pusense]|uniref:Uncharacterized protein n=1 Tax=Agrobacterium pusense TaxID=648995 RepID=U4Q4W1_9HYPH|nr:hypothetical protein [Agrobacterium pusense]CDI08750.1 conserved protein of unknown function [Agrobacterium pusense]
MSVNNLRSLAQSAANAVEPKSRAAVYQALEAMAKEIIKLRNELDDLKAKVG